MNRKSGCGQKSKENGEIVELQRIKDASRNQGCGHHDRCPSDHATLRKTVRKEARRHHHKDERQQEEQLEKNAPEQKLRAFIMGRNHLLRKDEMPHDCKICQEDGKE